MVQLIKKGGLRERANRSRRYQGSENTETTLQPNRYVHTQKKEETQVPPLLIDHTEVSRTENQSP